MKINRYVQWTVLLLAALLWITACSAGDTETTQAPPAAPTGSQPSGQPDSGKSQSSMEEWEKEWEQTLALAKQEGKLILTGKPGPDREAWSNAFQQKYPEIKVEFTGIRASEFAPRVILEYQNKQYLWDVAFDGSNNAKRSLEPAGILVEDIRDMIILPEILDDKNWHGGFEDGFNITESNALYAVAVSAPTTPYYNTDHIPAGSFTVDDLIDPKWKGKIVINDPRTPAHGAITLTGIYNMKGEPFLRKLMIDQEPVYVTNVRQITEWLATGRYPIAVGLDETYLRVMQEDGVGKNVAKVWSGLEPGIIHGSTIQPLRNPPNPNAAKIFVNWALSREGQEAYYEFMGEDPSRRTDVTEHPPEIFPGWDEMMKYEYTLLQDQGMKAMDFVSGLAKQIIK